MTETRSPDVARIIFTVLFVCGLAAASLWIVRPFLMAIVWAVTIVLPTWPILIALQRRLGNKRGAAVAVMTLLLLGVVFVPLVAAVVTISSNANDFAATLAAIQHAHVPSPPAWLSGIPVVGPRAAEAWQGMTGEDFEAMKARVLPYTDRILGWLKAHIGTVARALLQFLLTVVVAAVLYTHGEESAGLVRRFARRLGGDRGDGAVVLAGMAVKSVALGVVVTAVAQTIACGIGLAIAGVPFAPFLTVVIGIFCIAQVGPLPVLLPAVIWMYGTGQSGWGTFLLVWSIVFGMMDNVLRPILIRRGVDLPMLLVFAGVLGGLATLGLIGIFVGPVVLAVSHTLLKAWVAGPVEAAAAEG